MTNEVLTLAEYKKIAQITQAVLDDVLTELITWAIEWFEEQTDRVLAAPDTDISEDLDGTGTQRLWLRQRPIISVNLVQITDPCDDSVETLVFPDDFVIYNEDAKLEIKRNSTLFHSWTRGQRNVHVEYIPGFTNTTMPKGLKLAISSLVATAYKRLERQNAFSSKSYQGGSVVFRASDINDLTQKTLDRYKRKSSLRM